VLLSLRPETQLKPGCQQNRKYRLREDGIAESVKLKNGFERGSNNNNM
jgi:hypothetical protein